MNVSSESLWKDLLTSSEEGLRVSRKPSPRLMAPLSFLINTWPWARLPSLLCHEGPVIYDLGVSHRPWQGANSSEPNVFFHSVANEGGACKFCHQNDCVGIFSDASPGVAVNLFPGRCSGGLWQLLGKWVGALPDPGLHSLATQVTLCPRNCHSLSRDFPQAKWGIVNWGR